MIENMLAYDRLRRAHFLHFSSLAKTIFLCLQLPKFFIVDKNNFFLTMDPLNFQSELVLCKTYQTEAKEPFND